MAAAQNSDREVAESESADTRTEAGAPNREELRRARLIVCETLVTVESRIVAVAAELVTFETPRAKGDHLVVVERCLAGLVAARTASD